MESSSRIFNRKRPDSFVWCLRAILASTVLSCSVSHGQSSGFEIGGHTKYRLTYTTLPDDSVFRDLSGSDARDMGFDARINLGWDSGLGIPFRQPVSRPLHQQRNAIPCHVNDRRTI